VAHAHGQASDGVELKGPGNASAAQWVGLKERIFWYGYPLWFMVLAITLLRQRTGASEPG